MSKKIFLTIMVFTMLFGIFGCNAGSKKTVDSVESVKLTVNGMRGTAVYEIRISDQNAELQLFRKIFAGEEEILKPEKSAVCDTQTLTKLMNDCGVMRWDGFKGKHPKNVQDGDMFIFEAYVNNGQVIHAEGSANYPKGYHDFVFALNRLLSDSGG